MATNESTPIRAGASSVPYGHVIGSDKWRGTELAQLLQGKVKLVFEDGLGLVDFHLPKRTCILYISESDLVSGSAFKRRLVRFRKNFVVLELGMSLLPVTNQSEAAQLIFHLVQERSKEGNSNPFILKKRSQLSEPSILQTVQKIPGVGKVKAQQLLLYFPSINQLANASVTELETAVGRGIASQVHSFFRQTQ
ncbi:Fanconi anemia core complex-associated protein 24 isoform X2 [Bombina bombina]|uniref:Fanconi anemia core complex-associated protein 24 isoform X2 n=1 Tax=Bombina bombina TaxID=8345 RepID=UPI00235A97D6|nr:Fanconi anemia core complex-associated protein 24 isoform X2 [Bombina bombina]